MPDRCPFCASSALRTVSARKDLEVDSCLNCGVAFLKDPPSDPVSLYEDPHYYDAWWGSDEKERSVVKDLKELSAAWCLDQMAPYLPEGGRILEIGSAFGAFLSVAKGRGYQAAGVEVSAAAQEAVRIGHRVWQTPFEELDLSGESFHAVVMLDAIEHFADPVGILKKIKSVLDQQKGLLALATPDWKSLSCRLLGRRWPHWKTEHLFYYSKKALSRALEMAGLEVLFSGPTYKALSLNYLANHSAVYQGLPRAAVSWIRRLPFSSAPFMLPSGLFCLAKVRG